jgi:membrane-bound serine protease (ClpP class)
MDDPLTLAYVLIALGVVFLIAELFIPTGGICFLIAMGCFLAGIAVSFVYGDNRTGYTTLIVVFVIVPVILMGWFWVFPESMWASRLKPKFDDDATVANMPGNASLEQLRGRIGKTVSTLRPSGIAEFDGKRVDCMSEGMMIGPDQPVRCVDVRAGKVIVRQIDKPRLEDLENNFG